MGRTGRVLLLLLLAAGAAGGWRWWSERQAAAEAPAGPPITPAVPVATEPVQRGPLPIEILANGLVVPEAVITVRTRVDGQIEQVFVQEGQMVRRGQRLFQLDPRLSQAILAQQEAQLARDRALLARAQADLVRYQSLRGEGFAAAQRFEQAQADAASAAAVVRADEAVIAQTRLNIEFATIVAEMDGRLGTLPLRLGNFVRQAENTAMAAITQMDPILVQFSIPERWLPEIQAAMAAGSAVPRVRAQIGDDPANVVEGALVFVDSAVDTQTGTIALKGRFANTEGRLWPGQYVQVTVVPRIDPDALSVPSAAVQTGQQGRFVFVLDNGQARRRPVTVLRTAGDRTVVAAELAAEQRVIVEGAQRVADGTRVVERGRGQQQRSGLHVSEAAR